jgi:hypothetical protein
MFIKIPETAGLRRPTQNPLLRPNMLRNLRLSRVKAAGLLQGQADRPLPVKCRVPHRIVSGEMQVQATGAVAAAAVAGVVAVVVAAADLAVAEVLAVADLEEGDKIYLEPS